MNVYVCIRVCNSNVYGCVFVGVCMCMCIVLHVCVCGYVCGAHVLRCIVLPGVHLCVQETQHST